MCGDKWQRQAAIVVETVQVFSKQLTNVSINTSASFGSGSFAISIQVATHRVMHSFMLHTVITHMMKY